MENEKEEEEFFRASSPDFLQLLLDNRVQRVYARGIRLEEIEMGKLALDWAEAQEALELYVGDRDEFGRPKWTLMSLAERFGVGETTIYRVVNRRGPYRNLQRPMTEDELGERLAETARKMEEAQREAERPKEIVRDLLGEMLERGKRERERLGEEGMPKSPLEE